MLREWEQGGKGEEQGEKKGQKKQKGKGIYLCFKDIKWQLSIPISFLHLFRV